MANNFKKYIYFELQKILHDRCYVLDSVIQKFLHLLMNTLGYYFLRQITLI